MSRVEKAIAHTGGLEALQKEVAADPKNDRLAKIFEAAQAELKSFEAIYPHTDDGRERARNWLTRVIVPGLLRFVEGKNSFSSRRIYQQMRDQNIAKIYALNAWLDADSKREPEKKPFDTSPAEMIRFGAFLALKTLLPKRAL